MQSLPMTISDCKSFCRALLINMQLKRTISSLKPKERKKMMICHQFSSKYASKILSV